MNTILIGDAGGTNTQWRFLDKAGIAQFTTIGFNAFTHSLSEFVLDIQNNVPLDADRVYLYAAGIETNAQKEKIIHQLRGVLKSSPFLANDLLAAARATCLDQPGYACILGTGSNASFYDGKQVEKVSASLGYLLGDEGSGAYLGKMLLKKLFRKQLDPTIVKDFMEYHPLSVAETIQTLYQSEKPGVYLAQFSNFISNHINHPEIYRMVYDAFDAFFDAFFQKKPLDYPLHFVGSIAFHYAAILRQVGQDLSYQIQTIIESPIAGLTHYHQKYD
jgi:N-acetylglucosamine kinase-like BadF-type ATPase